MRVVFLGCSEFSTIVLNRLVESHHQVVCVVSSIDKESGRGKHLEISAIKKYALSHNIPILQYKRVSKEGEEEIRNFSPDVLVTASFGQMLKENILNLAPYGVINVHASLLPKYRGSCPINYCLINGEKETGITIMQTALAMDSGDILLQKSLPIDYQDTACDLTLKLAYLGGECIVEGLDMLEQGKAKFVKQNEDDMTYFPKLNKEMSYIDFDMTANQIHNFVRGVNPWPLARVNLKGEPLIVYSASPFDNLVNVNLQDYEHGEVVFASGKKGLVVRCYDGLVSLDVIQAPNGKKMDAKAYLNGKKIDIKTNLSRTQQDETLN